VELKVNKMASIHTQIPYDYYALKFCKPPGGVKQAQENLGEFLTGDRIESSPYQVTRGSILKFSTLESRVQYACVTTVVEEGARV